MTGNDSFGKDIRKSLEEINVDISGMKINEEHNTTLAFVSFLTPRTGGPTFGTVKKMLWLN